VRRSIACISVVLAVAVAGAAHRPYYGGTLRIAMRAQIRTLDPMEPAASAEEFAAKAWLTPLVYEPLVQFDAKGAARPQFAVSWTRNGTDWEFVLRKAMPEFEPVRVLADRTIERVLSDKARSSTALRANTGSFKIDQWEPGKSARLVANEDYWGARPYLDAIEIQMGRELKDQAADLSLGKVDVTETGERKGLVKNTLALVFANDRVPPAVREALSLAIDRNTIQRVLARTGEATQALLPRWLSGYAMLFAKDRDVARARQLAAGAPVISFFYDRQDVTLRRIAERITVNAMDAGVTLRPSNAGAADVRLDLLPVTTDDEFASLMDLAALLKLPFPAAAASPYEAERLLLDGFRVIPVLHLPDAWAASPRVHNWPDLANVWMDPTP